MRITCWLIGCALCIVGIGSAAAASRATQDLSAPHPALDPGGSSSGGDTPGLARDCPSHNRGGGAVDSSASGNDRSSGGSSAPTSTRRAHLGWQSLLPGSIQ